MDRIDYQERMINYYPPVIKSIGNFQAIVDAEYPEIEELHEAMDNALNNAYLLNMDENRIKQWEKVLDIKVLGDSTIEQRRDVVIARLRGQGKLNTNTINTIVNTFTGGSANSWIENSVLYVEVTPSPTNKEYRFENIENELRNKIPSHLGLVVTRNYYTWQELKDTNPNWSEVKDKFDNWEDVLLYVES